jgi:hypothetical protein
MNMPGFTAEVSLYETSRYYRMNCAPGIAATSRGVVPQDYCDDLCAGDDNCHDWCIEAVYGGIFDSDGHGGSHGGGLPPEYCGPCQKSGPHKGMQRCVVPGHGFFWDDC